MVIGFGLFVLYLYFYVGFDKIIEVLTKINSVQYVFFYSMAIASILLGILFWSMSWRNVLHSLSIKLSLKNSYLYYWTGYFVDLVVPCETVCGEVTRLYLVYKETDKNPGEIAAGGLVNRIVAYLIVVVGLYSSTVLLILRESEIPDIVEGLLGFILVGATIYLAVLLYLAFSKSAAKKLGSIGVSLLKLVRPKKYGSSDLSERVEGSLSAFYNGFKLFREKPRLLVKPFVFLTLSFVLNLLAYVLVFFALDINSQPFAFFIVIYFIGGSVQDAAAGFSVGTLEIILSTLFILYGINPGLSGITAAIVRSVTFWFPLIVGYIVVQIVGVKKLLAPRTN
jgi:hypothetical protein